MSKKYTFLIIPDDDSITKSYEFKKSSVTFLFVFFIFILSLISLYSFISIPKIMSYHELKTKYDILSKDRLEVYELSKNLKRIKQMDDFVRHSLGVNFSFKDQAEANDSIESVLQDENNFISITDNIPSVAPVDGFISQRMSLDYSDIYSKHSGIDIVTNQGSPIKASANGLVIFSSWNYDLGNLIILYHGDGYFTHYGHNQQNLVDPLDFVSKGEVIGLVGNTGISSGPHLHFEIWKDNISINPLKYFPEYKKTDLTYKNE